MPPATAAPSQSFSREASLRWIVVVEVVFFERVDLEVPLEVMDPYVEGDGVDGGDHELEDITGDDEEGERVGCEGKLLKVDHPRELSYTWRFPGNPELADEAPSRVSFRLEPVAEHTKLTVVHDQFPAESKMLVMVSGGWPYVLAGLKTLLETGAAIDFSSLPGQAA